MMGVRQVRGILFLDYVRMIKAHKSVDWEKQLPPEDIDYLTARIDPNGWYPMASFERMGNAILEHVAGGQLNAVHHWGRLSATMLHSAHPMLLEKGDPVETVRRFRVQRATYFDFEALEVPMLHDGEAHVIIHYYMGMPAEEALAKAMSVAWHRFQMPAYHLIAEDGHGISLVNIGVGPANAKNITDHLAVLRPHCWLMIGHCGGLRQSQTIGDYVLAHGYLRQDGILDDVVPPDMPIPALAEVQVALQEAAAQVTGDHGEALKRRLRTGTVMTNDDRNWEFRWQQERRRINLSRAIAVDMESGTIAAQGYRLRVPYGTLLCVSDKPLHGEIKLPGAANAFYERAVGEHLEIGLAALDLLRTHRVSLHSRKLRSFDEPPFR